jgi:crossover junction endonuclease EME1
MASDANCVVLVNKIGDQVHEKEFLLKDLKVENLVGRDTSVGEACSKRIYRVLMSLDGTIKTDDVENGAASFTLPPSDLI